MFSIIFLITTNETRPCIQNIFTPWSISIMYFHFLHTTTEYFFAVVLLRQEISFQNLYSFFLILLEYLYQFCKLCWNNFLYFFIQKQNNWFLITFNIFISSSVLYHHIPLLRMFVYFHQLFSSIHTEYPRSLQPSWSWMFYLQFFWFHSNSFSFTSHMHSILSKIYSLYHLFAYSEEGQHYTNHWFLMTVSKIHLYSIEYCCILVLIFMVGEV